MTDSPLERRLAAGGAVFGEIAGRPVARHFGDSLAEYRAAREGAAIADRADLAQIRMWGRDPVKMLNGLITNDLARAAPGQGVYATMLTAKGRTIAELRVFRRTGADGPELLLVLPREALEGTRAHLKKFVPPMFARWEDVSERSGTVGVYGPEARRLLGRTLGQEVPEMKEDEHLEAPFFGQPVLVAATRYAGGEEGFDIFAPGDALPPLWDALLEGGAPTARPLGFGALETLRIEAGRPRYGAELTEEVIPTEAFEATGMMPRAVSFTKGCYTGQEVIIRIAHRGHVNRHLRGLLMGDSPAPSYRTPLYHPESGKQIGWTASAAVSPLLNQTVALGFVRRELLPGATVRLGAADGRLVTVAELPFRLPNGTPVLRGEAE
ncbi:glycine cleavage T C-terminal barrel domain-containing protein [soil metagenome]|nr:aminomethyl transferase family protein [Gemmatimonadota bacterium]